MAAAAVGLFLRFLLLTGVDPVWWIEGGLGRKRRGTLGNTHKRYAPEYRQRMVELVRAGRNAEELAREFLAIDSQLGSAGRS